MYQAQKTALWAALALAFASIPAAADITAVDSTFNGGIVELNMSRPVYARGSLLAPDNGVYLYGFIDISGNNFDYSVVKLAVDGSVDTDFGSPDYPGEYRADFNQDQDEMAALAQLQNGDLVLVGYSANGDNTPATWDPHLIKVETDRDAYEWGTDVSGMLNRVYRAYEIESGKVLVLGDYWTYPNGPSTGARVFGALVRLNSDGSLDTSFGDNGRTLFSNGVNQSLSIGELVMAVDASGRILIGYPHYTGGKSASLIRLLANGQSDSSFPTQTISSTSNTLQSKALHIDSMNSNAIYWLLDEETDTNTISFRVAKFAENGSRDNNFGRLSTNRPTSYNNEFVQMPDGRLMIAGDTQVGGLRLTRLDRDGQPDATFGTGGYQTVLHSLAVPRLAGLHLLENGKLILTGDHDNFPNQKRFAMRLEGYDLVPDTITVSDKIEVAPGSTQYFGPTPITGTDGGVISNSDAGFYMTAAPSCDQSATYSTSDKRFISGEGICLKQVAASALGTRTTSTLQVNSQSVTFSSVTEVPDAEPNSFSFTARESVTVNTRVESNAIVVAGINVPSAIAVTNGEYRIDAGEWTQAAGTVQAGNAVSVRHTTSADFEADTTTALSIGGVAASFVSTTEAADVVPDAVVFSAVGDIVRGTVVQSNTVTVTGINTPVPVSIAGGEYRLDNGDWTQSAGQVLPGQSVTVRHTASASFASATSSSLSVGSGTATFISTTEAEDATPNAFSFAGQTGVQKGVTVVSVVAAPTGFNTPVAISVTGGEYSIDGGAFTASAGQLTPGQQVVVRHTSASAAQASVTTTLTVGGVSAAFTSTTKADEAAGGGGGGSLGASLLLLLVPLARRRARQSAQ